MGCAWLSLSSCLDVVPEATRLWKPEMAPHAMVMNSAGNRKPEAAALFVMALPASSTSAWPVEASKAAFVATKPVNAGICRLDAAPMSDAPTMPMTAKMIMPYSR